MTEISLDQFEQISARVEKLLAELARLRAKNKDLNEQIKGLETRAAKSQKGGDRADARQAKERSDLQNRLEVLIDRLETAEAELV